MTDRSTWIAEKRQLDKLRTLEGQAQDCLERTLPQSVVADAQKREMWAVHPDVAASSAVFDSVLALVQTLFFAIGDKTGAKSFGTWFQGGASAPQELDAWCRKLVGKALTTDSFNRADKFRAEAQTDIEAKATELRLRFIHSARQCAFPIYKAIDGCVNGTDTSVFSAEMREVISTLPGIDEAFWDFAKEQAMPKPITETERWHLKARGMLGRALKEKTDEVSALVGFCGFMADGGKEPTRTEEVLALCALCRAFHTSRCRDKSLPDELKLGWKLFRRMSALRNELIRIASAAADWEWIANRNPDVPADELTKIVTEAYRENSWPRGKLNVDYDTWHDLLNGGRMALYPDVRPDALYILSAQNNSLGLWRVL